MRQVQPERPTYLIFLTDGQPTNGDHRPEPDRAGRGRRSGAERAPFRVRRGYDVNTLLLDRLARENRGTADYVKPEENLEERLSAFYTKVALPVLTDVRLEIQPTDPGSCTPTHCLTSSPASSSWSSGVTQRRTDYGYPRGSNVDGRRERLAFGDLTLVDDDRRANYLPGLWATRRVGIPARAPPPARDEPRGGRRSGRPEHPLWHRHALYVVFREEQVDVANANGSARGGRPGAAPGRRRRRPPAPGSAASQTTQALQNAPVAGGVVPRPAAAPGPATRASDGLTEARVQRVAERAFVLRDNVWVDTAYLEGQPRRRVSLGTDDYFALLAERPVRFGLFRASGERVIVVLDGVRLRGRRRLTACAGRVALAALIGLHRAPPRAASLERVAWPTHTRSTPHGRGRTRRARSPRWRAPTEAAAPAPVGSASAVGSAPGRRA